jgi:DNA polymerase
MILSIDLETYSDVDLAKTSVYRYAEDPSFEILLLGYAFDDDPVTVIDVAAGGIPDHLLGALTDHEIIKVAFNASFERICLSHYMMRRGLIDTFLPPEQWQDTMIQALSCGLPRSLAGVGQALGLSEDEAKMKEGKALIQYFCKPCKATKANGGRTRNLPQHDMRKWLTFEAYNARDVETERTIRKRLEGKPVPMIEWKAWWLDQRINDRGVLIDRKLMENAIRISREHTAELTAEAEKLTGLENVNSVSQLKGWLGVDGSLDKKAIRAMRDSGNLDLRQDRLLAIRQEMGKTSVSKYEAMERGVCRDGRIRGLFQFYGANRTGRWAGRQVQVQNLPQNHISNLDTARGLVSENQGDRTGIILLYGNVPDVLSQLIRTAFVAPVGRTFAVADFSAIEARVLAWLAGEEWRMEVFAKGGDIYCASASQMFRVPVEKHGQNAHLRQKGKIAELALGYGGAVGALTAMGALDMGLKEDELQPLVTAWRNSNPNVVAFWWDVDRMVKNALDNPGTIQRLPCAADRTSLCAQMTRNLLSITLPSGRRIRYYKPKIDVNRFGSESITYAGLDSGKWGRVETYGPKLVENIVQATSRDCLRDAMMRVAEVFPDIVMHVHDEMIVEVNEEQAEDALGYMQECMGKPIEWAPGLLLRGDGYTTKYYRKD